MITPDRKPFEPVTGAAAGGHGRLSKLCKASPHKRQRSSTIAFSQEALNVLFREGAKVDGSVGTITGLVIDYLARHGRFADVLKEAIAELEGQSS